MLHKMLTKLLPAVCLSVTVWAVGVAPVAASDVDLGQPASMAELVASPEYRNEHAGVLRLYLAFLDRQPDVAGAVYWIDQYEDGRTEDDLAWGFAQSAEFANLYGTNLDNAGFLSVVYTNILGRSPDQAGFDYWLGQMNNGLAKHQVVRWIVANDEFIRRAPFTRTSPDLSVVLVAPGDVDPTLDAYTIDGPMYSVNDVPARTLCEQPLVLPENASGTFYIQDVPVAAMTKFTISSDVYGFSDPIRSSAMIAEIKRSFQEECADFVDNYGGTDTYRNVTVPAWCSTCVTWEMTNLSPNFGGRVFYTRAAAIAVGYSISIVEVSGWVLPNEADLRVLADRVRSRLEAVVVSPPAAAATFERVNTVGFGCSVFTGDAGWSARLRVRALPGPIISSDTTLRMSSAPLPDGYTQVGLSFRFLPNSTSSQEVILRSGPLTIVIPAGLYTRPTCQAG
ncbi:MAG: DUF4214 domain-containing protein [Acidimicrobiales bacterium]